MNHESGEQMSAMETGQVNRSAAAIYEKFFVPALFAEWPDRMLDAVSAGPRMRTLDVACGTGVLARAAAKRIGNSEHVVGLDSNDEMLTVARESAPEITWRLGVAEELPFADSSFDCVVSQFGLMFFDNSVQALQEMARVSGQKGRIAVAVWDSLERTPGYMAMVGLLQRLFGDDVANGLRAPFVLGDAEILHCLCLEAGLHGVEIMTHTGTARFPSLESWLYTDIRGWTLADSIDDAQYAHLLKEARRELAEFVQKDGTVSFASPAHIVTAVG